MSIKRGDIFYADLNPPKDSEQAGKRPVLIIQNDIGNEKSPAVIIAPFTTKKFSKEYPTNITLKKGVGGLKNDSVVLLSQIRTIDKSRLEQKIGSLPYDLMREVNEAIKISLGLA